MIARPLSAVPVPDAVAVFAGRRLPARVRVAVGDAAEAARLYAACRGPQYAEARLRHVDDGSAEEELHRHVVRVHGGVCPKLRGSP